MPKYVSPTEAMSHQREALRRRALRPPGYDDVFADQQEMGCGKTKVAIDEWQESVSLGYVSDLLVVAPAGCLRNWHEDRGERYPSELRRHLDPRLLRLTRVAAWGGRASARRAVRDLADRADDAPRALFVNVEALSTSEEAVTLCVKFMRGTRRGVTMIVDESTTIRAKNSERTRVIVRRLRSLAKVRRIMTGLMTPKSPLDLFWQFYFLDPRILGFDDSYVAFRARYAKTKRACYEPSKMVRAKLRRAMGLDRECSPSYYRERLRIVYDGKRRILPTMPVREVKSELEVAAGGMSREQAVECIIRLGGWIKSHVEVEEYRNLDELKEKIAPFSYRVLKRDCLDLPPKIYMPLREVKLSSEQRRMYDEILRHATTELESQHVVASTVLAQMAKLHQIVLGHARNDDTGELFDVPSNRIPALIEVLEDHDGKAVIWSSYRREVDKIVAELSRQFGPQSVAQFHGGNKSTRGDEESRFLNRDECRYMVSTQAAGGRGNTWVVADLACYCSNTYDLEHRAQSEDRIDRVGQTMHPTYQDFAATGTVEERILYALREKIDLAAVINGDNWREWVV